MIVPRRFRILSRKMSSKFQSVATGQLGIMITQVVEEWLLQGKSVPALVLLREIVNYYDTGNAPGILYNILDLQKLQVKNGNLEAFLNTWFMVLRGMKDDVGVNVLELSLIHISEPTRLGMISYAVFCLKKKT